MSKFVLVLTLAVLLALPTLVNAIPMCSQYGCIDPCPNHSSGVPTMLQGYCNPNTQLKLVKCWWTCGCESDWILCHCPNCDCPPDGGGGGGCFLAGAPILMADGSTKSIDQVRTGDSVQAFDRQASALSADRVAVIHTPRIVDGYYLINGIIALTGSQPVLSGNKWVLAKDLKEGDLLAGSSGNGIPVRSIKYIEQATMVYNLGIEHMESYVAYGIVVHNKNYEYTIYPCDDCGP